MIQQSPPRLNPVRQGRQRRLPPRRDIKPAGEGRSATPTLLAVTGSILLIWYFCTRYFDDGLIGLIIAGIVLITFGAPALGAAAVGGGASRRPS